MPSWMTPRKNRKEFIAVNRKRTELLIFVASILLAFVLQLTPLPQSMLPFKPYWIALVLIYWAIEAPDRIGLGFAFLLGLSADILTAATTWRAGFATGNPDIHCHEIPFPIAFFPDRATVTRCYLPCCSMIASS